MVEGLGDGGVEEGLGDRGVEEGGVFVRAVGAIGLDGWVLFGSAGMGEGNLDVHQWFANTPYTLWPS